jgi:hypothetical protein
VTAPDEVSGLREYRITFDRLAKRGAPIPALDLTALPMTNAEIVSAVRGYLTAPPDPYVPQVADVKVSDRREHGVWGTVTRPGRGDSPPVAVVEFHVLGPRLPVKRPRGRPPVGPATNLRLTPELRGRLDAATRPGEGVAEAARRLLAVALDPILPGALALAAAAWDGDSSAECEACAAEYGGLCARHARSADLADAARRLAAEVAAPPGADRSAAPWGDESL